MQISTVYSVIKAHYNRCQEYTFALLLLIFCMLIPYASHAQYIGEDVLRGEKSVSVPFSSIGGFIVVKLNYNGIIPLNFIFDTGASNTILFDRTYADIFNTAYTDTIEVIGADIIGGLDGYVARQGTFTIANAGINVDRDYIVLSEDIIRLEESLGVPIHGILGSNFFRRLTLKINYVKRTITLYNPSKYNTPAKYEKIDSEVVNGKPYINTNITTDSTSATIQVLLDTGADVSTILHSNVSNSVTIPQNSVPGYLGTGLSGHIVGYIGRLESLSIGSNTFSQLIANYQEIEIDSLSPPSASRAGIIGNTILSRFHIIIDFIKGEVYLKPNKYARTKFKTDKSGLVLNAFGENLNLFVVHYVYPNSAAHTAGIRRGDIIEKVGRCKSKSLTLNKIMKNFQRKPGKTIRLTLLRNGSSFTTRLILKELI